MRNKKYLSNDHVLIACGVTLGIALGFMLDAIIGFSKDKSVASLFIGSKPEDGRLEWETLLGGVFALFAAAITVVVMRWQTRHLIERKALATQAMLPLSLLSMITYSKECLGYLRVTKGLYDNNAISTNMKNDEESKIKLPDFPNEQIRDTRDYIENGDQDNTEILANYIATLQVHLARMREIEQSILAKGSDNLNFIGTVRSSIIDAAEIYRFSEKILSFARRHSKTIGAVTSDEICSCLWWFMRSDYESDSDLQKRAKEWTPLMDVSDWNFLMYSQKQNF